MIGLLIGAVVLAGAGVVLILVGLAVAFIDFTVFDFRNTRLRR